MCKLWINSYRDTAKKRNLQIETKMGKLNIENLFIKKVKVDDDFNYTFLYNDDRGSVYKDQYKSLIKEAVSKKNNIQKLTITENVPYELLEICEIKGSHYSFFKYLKAHPNEGYHVIAPLIYLTKRLEEQFTIKNTEGNLKFASEVQNIKVCPRIDNKNATPRIFLPKENIAFVSTNDNIGNLVDILAVKNIAVYIIGMDNLSNNIYAYKFIRDNRFFDALDRFKGINDRLIAELFKPVNKKEP